MNTMEKILEVKNLHTCFQTRAGSAEAVGGISFSLEESEILGIIGESGSGKSVAVKSILQILPKSGETTEGEIWYRGKNLVSDSRAMEEVRGKEITMIFQEPMTSLNPVLTIGRQLTEGIMQHLKLSRSQAQKRACEYLKRVKITNPEELLTRYPHHLSGGMRQRVMIAMALSTDAHLLIADEATTALDVTIQQQIIYLLKELRDQLHMSILFITHDMGLINEIADNTGVMYCGRIQEYASTYELMKRPLHPYTKALLAAIPGMEEGSKKLSAISGNVPSLFELPPGCRFSNRCRESRELCGQREPALYRLPDGHKVRCWKYAEAGRKEECER